MVRFAFGDEAYEIPKFKLREIKAAGPFFDRVNARQRDITRETSGMTASEILEYTSQPGHGLENMTEITGDLVRILAVGVLHAKKEYPFSVASIEAQAQLIEAELALDELDSVNTAFEEIAKEAGMIPSGPTKAAGKRKPASPSESPKS